MYYKVFETDDTAAPYLTAEGKPCILLSCLTAYTPLGVNEGWASYKSKSGAIRALGLSVNPQALAE